MLTRVCDTWRCSESSGCRCLIIPHPHYCRYKCPCTPSQDEAAAFAAEGATAAPLPPLPEGPWGENADATAAALAARRVALAERESALQRWAAALGLEAGQAGTAAARLAAAQQQVTHFFVGGAHGSCVRHVALSPPCWLTCQVADPGNGILGEGSVL